MSDINWQMLTDELDLWQAAGKTAAFWWRDDDASKDTSQLRQLDQLSRDSGVPVTVAVIPARLEDSLAEYLRGRENFTVVQHGFAHQSYAAKGQKKIEIGGLRKLDDIASELCQGMTQLSTAFTTQFLPVLVPPWNRIDVRTYNMLSEVGFCGLSSMWARKASFPCEGLLQVNTHLDPVNWRKDRGFIPEHQAINDIYLHLFGRRTGFLDGNEPTGILTHHLDQTEDVWEFCKQLFLYLNSHPAVQWQDARNIWRARP